MLAIRCRYVCVGQIAYEPDNSYLCGMRQTRMLSDYLLLGNGSVMEADTLDGVQLTDKGNYKLLTDEKVWLDTKQTHIRLWRRFTAADIMKLYEQGKHVDIDAQLTDTPLNAQVPTECTGTQVEESAQVTAGKSAQVCINAQVYKSISDASAQLSINRRTIKKRLDDPSNHDYTYVD